jgi:hypothetical protein
LQGALDALAPLRDVAGRKRLGIAAARRQLLAREAVQLQEGGVDVDHLQVRVAQDEGVGRSLENGAVLLFAQAQRLLGLLLLGDVAAEREDARHAADLDGLQSHFIPGNRAVGPAPPPLVGRTVAVARELEIAARVGFAVGRVARAEGRERRAEHVLAAKARGGAGFRIDVDQRAGVPVVDDDTVLDGLEDRSVALLRLPHRLVGAHAFDLGGGADGEDLHHRLDPVEPTQRRARGDRDQAQVLARAIGQRIAGVAFDRVRVQAAVAGKERRRPLGNDAKAVAHHSLARRAGERIRASVDRSAVHLHCEHVHRPGIGGRTRDEGHVDAQDPGERSGEFREHCVAACRGNGERCSAQDRFGGGSLELGGDPTADDLEHRLCERDVGERRAIHDGEQAQPFAVAVAEREGGVRVHAFGCEQAARPELGRQAAHHVAEFAADDLLAWRSGDRVFERHEALAVEQGSCSANALLAVVGEDGDQTRRGAEAVGHLANEVVEERRTRRASGRKGDAVQRLRVSVPGGGLDGGRNHEPV